MNYFREKFIKILAKNKEKSKHLAKFAQKKKSSTNLTSIRSIAEIGAVQQNAHLVDLKNAGTCVLEYLFFTSKDRRRYSRERA